MSRRESKVDTYVDTLSSGDSNIMQPKQKTKEVNNNEVDELSKEFSEMGCVVDAMKRPPNICVENCIYESDSEKSEKSETHNDNEEDAYSDEFEEEKSEEEEETVETETKSEKNESSRNVNPSSNKRSKSQSSMFSNKPPVSMSGRSGRSGYGSLSVPQTRRVNMSFTNERLRDIERHNHILLTKILSVRNTKKSSIPPREQPLKKIVPSAAVSRKNQQRQIDRDNMILLKKIQGAKSSALSLRR